MLEKWGRSLNISIVMTLGCPILSGQDVATHLAMGSSVPVYDIPTLAMP
jgi:hypothetical protein